MQLHPLIAQAIWDRYVPRIPDPSGATTTKKVGSKEVETPLLIPDPRVIYVGPMIDGLVKFMPEVFGDDVSGGSVTATGRRKVKNHLMDVSPGARALNSFGGALLWMQRDAWRDKQGKLRTITLTDHLRDLEPGMIRNAVFVQQDSSTGEEAIMMWEGPQAVPSEPLIFEEKRYGLHYLMRDDFIQYEVMTRKGEHVVRQFRLRPVGEGTSELKQATRTDAVLW